MKELSIEDKAKRYDEALKVANKYKDIHIMFPSIQDEMFPELAESEDERIRKELIEYFRWNVKQILNDFSNKECVAWLEKQGEPTDINPSEFDLRLNKLLKQFESMSKEELASSLIFYLNVIQNDGTYKEEKQGEQKPAWSEEDEEILKVVINSCEQCGNQYAYYWLKSLKDRYTWKPTEAQMKALLYASSVLSDYDSTLTELYNDLKKLNGE